MVLVPRHAPDAAPGHAPLSTGDRDAPVWPCIVWRARATGRNRKEQRVEHAATLDTTRINAQERAELWMLRNLCRAPGDITYGVTRCGCHLRSSGRRQASARHIRENQHGTVHGRPHHRGRSLGGRRRRGSPGRPGDAGSPRVDYQRYWVDEAAGKIFCLVEAPHAEAAHTVHREAHGLVADEIYSVSEHS